MRWNRGQYIVDLVQVLDECNPNAPKKYWDQVNNIVVLDFSADPGTKYKHEKDLLHIMYSPFHNSSALQT